MQSLIGKLRAGLELDAGDVSIAVSELLSDQASDDQKAEFLTLLHQRGETAGEIAAFVRLLIERAVDPGIEAANLPGPMIDVCGTGGDGLDFFNVSTTIMFILAAGGAVVVKHGNRGVTSACGSADVLEALGVPLVLEPDKLQRCVEQIGLGFIFARYYHPAFRAIAEMRKRLARENTRTIFNLLGPLLNPARPPFQLIGVFAPRLTTVFAEVLRQLHREKSWVVHGLAETGAGMDDLSISGVTTVAETEGETVRTMLVEPGSLGISPGSLAELRGGDAAENARTLTGILTGEIGGAKRDLVLLNAAAGFVVCGLTNDLSQGIELAREQIESGRALAKLRALQQFGERG
jgi:anthranilate phosphoribosyltransferase